MDGFLIGNFIGAMQVLVGHPFDTIKTHLQLNVNMKWTLRHLYSGAKYPIYSSCISNAFLFGTYDWLSRGMSPVFSAMLCGAMSGVIMSPFETLKIREQLGLGQEAQRNAPRLCWAGVRSLIIPGLGWTVLRETVGTPIYFESFSYLDKHCPTFIAGGSAGVLSWAAVYNLDLWKTRAQSMVLSKPKSQRYALAITLLRAFIVNGVNLSIYRRYMPHDPSSE